MPIQNGARLVSDGFVVVVPVHQHRVDAGHGPNRTRTGPFQQLSHHRESRRRVTASGGRFTYGQADFALRHAGTGQGIHHQQDVAARVPVVLSDPGSSESGAFAQHRGLIRSRHHHDRTGQTLLAQVIFQKLPDLPPALAHQGDNTDFGIRAASNHRHQSRFADPGTGKQANALASPQSHQGVQNPHPHRDGHINPGALQRVGSRPVNRHPVSRIDRAFTVKRATRRINDPTQQSRTDRNCGRQTGTANRRTNPQTVQIVQGHTRGDTRVQRHHFGGNSRIITNQHDFTHRALQAADLHRQAHNGLHLTDPLGARGVQQTHKRG